MSLSWFHLRVLSTECAVVSGMLGDLHLLDDLTKGGTISGSVLSANADLLGVVALLIKSIISQSTHDHSVSHSDSDTSENIPL